MSAKRAKLGSVSGIPRRRPGRLWLVARIVASDPRNRDSRRLYDDQRNVQRVSVARRVEEEKIMVLVEGVAFALGVLMLAVSTYLMAIETIRKAKRSQ